MHEGPYEETVHLVDEALQVKPDFVETLSNRATALSELGGTMSSRGFAAALSLDPITPSAGQTGPTS